MSDEEKSTGQIVLAWWTKYIGARDSAAARALAARLRRGSMIEVLSEGAVHELARNLEMGANDAERLARLVMVLCEVREHADERLPRRLGEKKGDGPVFSQSRFQRLMRAEGESLVTALRRALPMVDRKCNVAALGQDIFFWSEKTRTRWCFDYFRADIPEFVEENV